MAEGRNAYTIRDGEIGSVRISEDVLSSIAAIATVEVKGVSSLAGSIKNDIKQYIGMKKNSQGIKVEYNETILKIDVAIKVEFGCNVFEVSKAVQERVKSAVENMTGIAVDEVNVKIADVNIEEDE